MKVDAGTECGQLFLALFLVAGRMNGPAVAGILAGELEAEAVIATCNQDRGHGNLPS